MKVDRSLSGASLIAAASLFWVAWLLMPGVGITDARLIFELVSSHRSAVMLSVIIQLISAALYVPALLGIASCQAVGASRTVRWASSLLLLGAMGSAADAVFHLLAYVMTAPGLDQSSLLPVMIYIQGPGLLLVAPLILSFFIGGAWLSVALAKLGKVRWGSVWAHAAAVGFAFFGGAGAAAGIIPSRAVGLMTLGAVSAAQIWAGLGLWRGAVTSGRNTEQEAP